MSGFDGKFISVKNDWITPQELFEEVDAEFHFTVDGAASPENTKCSQFFERTTDAMTQEWAPHTVWLNPPYGEGYPISRWVKKAWEESQKGATVVVLIPARTNTRWFHEYCLAKGEVRFIKGRPKFGGAMHGLPQPLCFVVFRRRSEDHAT